MMNTHKNTSLSTWFNTAPKHTGCASAACSSDVTGWIRLYYQKQWAVQYVPHGGQCGAASSH